MPAMIRLSQRQAWRWRNRNQGVAQVLFLESDEVCEVSYADRGGKYQGQSGVTLPKA